MDFILRLIAVILVVAGIVTILRGAVLYGIIRSSSDCSLVRAVFRSSRNHAR